MASLGRIYRAARHAWRMTNPWSPLIRDGRGRIVPLYRIDRGLKQATGSGDLPDPVFARIRQSLLKKTRAGMGSRPIGLVLGAAVYVGLYFWVRSYRNIPSSRITAWVMLGCAALFPGSNCTTTR